MVMVAITIVGCTPDRSADADRIRVELQGMPGVAAMNVAYINDFENGANLSIDLDMTRATEPEIGAAAHRVEELVGTQFSDHRQKTTITVADRAGIEYSAGKSPEYIVTVAQLLRGLRARSGAGTIEWLQVGGPPNLEIWDSPEPDADLRAALGGLSTVVPTPADGVVHVRSGAYRKRSGWNVALPLTHAQMDVIVGQRDRLPVIVFQVDVLAAAISGLSVDLGAPDEAYGNALAVVAAVAPTRAHPVTVEWRMTGAAPAEVARFTACAPAEFAPPPVSGFAQLKERLEDQFAGCCPA